MPQYSGYEQKTNVTSEDLVTLDAAANEDGKVVECIIGGEPTTSTAGRVRLSRSGSGATPVSGDVQNQQPNAPTNAIQLVDGWSTDPTLVAGALMGTSWNLHGGVVRWQAAPGEEFDVIGAEQISFREELSTAVLSGTLIWNEFA